MKIGALKPVPVDDVTFYLKPTWGAKKRYQAGMLKLDWTEDGDAEKRAEIMERVDELRDTLLRETVVRVDGIADEAGQPVRWDEIALEELPPDVVERVFEAALIALGLPVPQAADGQEVAEAQAEEGNA